jgi:hypothetical protein
MIKVPREDVGHVWAHDVASSGKFQHADPVTGVSTRKVPSRWSMEQSRCKERWFHRDGSHRASCSSGVILAAEQSTWLSEAREEETMRSTPTGLSSCGLTNTGVVWLLLVGLEHVYADCSWSVSRDRRQSRIGSKRKHTSQGTNFVLYKIWICPSAGLN